MTALDYILDGLEAELALERELGVRFVECDRGLLAGGQCGAAGVRALSVAQPVGSALRADRRGQEARDARRGVEDARRETRDAKKTPTAVQPQPQPQPQPSTSTFLHPFVFLHDRPLSPAGIEMMAKIVTAMGTTAERAPIVFEKPIPRAMVYVVLGELAMRKFLPMFKWAPNVWFTTAKGVPMLASYSPEYILRFKEITPAVKKIKRDMWQSLKSVLQRAKG